MTASRCGALATAAAPPAARPRTRILCPELPEEYVAAPLGHGYFPEKPVQNWTRTSSSILGTAFLHVDYSAPVEALRVRLREIVEGTELWDRRVCVLQVTELRGRTMELRALVSASSAWRAWDLHCEVREKLIPFLQEQHPGALLRVRAEVDAGKAEKAAAAGVGSE